MAVVEKSGLMKYKDEAGNLYLMYPITTTDNVNGLEEWDKALLLKNDLAHWTQTTLPANKDWSSICYGNGKFVAVADGATIAAYSTDGITWTQTTLPDNAPWVSVCYGNGKFVAVAYAHHIAAYSTDGITWTKTTLPVNARWSSVCYGGDKFVAVAKNNNISVCSAVLVVDPAGINVTNKLKTALGMDELKVAGILKGDGNGDISAATAGTDYVTPNGMNAAIQSAIQNTWEASY